jgi:hypothetical protein
MHSARALFLTFLALEKSKRNNTLHENYAAAQDLQRIKLHRKTTKNSKENSTSATSAPLR